MFKLFIFVFGLAIGGVGGIMWGRNHPVAAENISTQVQQEKQKLEDKVKQVTNDINTPHDQK
jgi:hypothetical protein